MFDGDPSAIRLVACEEDDKSVLANLLQLYLHDFSPMTGGAVNRHGLFGYPYLDHYWTRDGRAEGRAAFLIVAGDELAGFALKNRHSRLGNDGKVSSVAEFFVLRRWRGRGVGRAAATRLFDLFPGAWEVAQIEPNVDAHRFWRRVIDKYTAGIYTVHTLEDDRWRRWVLAFETPLVGEV